MNEQHKTDLLSSFEAAKREHRHADIERYANELLSDDTLEYELRLKLQKDLSDAFLQQGRSADAHQLLEQLIELVRSKKDAENELSVLYLLGRVCIILMDVPGALKHFQLAKDISVQLGKQAKLAELNASIGIVHIQMSDFKKAFDYLLTAIKQMEVENNLPQLAAAYANLGVAYFSDEQFDAALEFYQKALELNIRQGHKLNVANIHSNIGRLYIRLSQFEKALDYFLQAKQLYIDIGNVSGLTTSAVGIANLYNEKKAPFYDPKKAEQLYLQCLTDLQQQGQKTFLFESHENLYFLYKEQQRYPEALYQLEMARAVEKESMGLEANQHTAQLENRRKIDEAERDRQVKLARFQEQEKILHNILPSQIAERILDGEKKIADRLDQVSVFFSDIVGFTQLSQNVSAEELVDLLNEIFTAFDHIAQKHGLEKIKTIGDAYMAVAGAPVPQEDHAERTARFALEVMRFMEDYRKRTKTNLSIRVGLHCGHAVAGIIGEKKFAYDLWGDAVNTASRMESHGEAGKIQLSEDFRMALADSSFLFTERGEMEVKGKGKMKTYYLNATE